ARPARANSHRDKDEREENMNQASHRSFSKGLTTLGDGGVSVKPPWAGHLTPVNSCGSPRNFTSRRAAFIYGTDPALHEGTTTDFLAIGRGRKAVGIEATATFLQPGTTYYYRAIGFAA